jgi:hypothetical protein
VKGIISPQNDLDLESIKVCKPVDFKYEYHGKLETVYSGKYFPSNDTRRDCSGFFGYDISPKLKQNQIFISFLKNIMFLEYRTEFFLIQFNGYNPINRNFITIKLIFEQTSDGLSYTNYNLCTLNIFEEINLLLNFKLQAETLAFLVINFFKISYTLHAVYSITKKLIENYKNSVENNNKNFQYWNVFKIFKISIYLIAILLRISLYFTIFNTIGIDKADSFIDTDSLCDRYQTLLFLEALMTCLTLIYFLKFLDKRVIEPISKIILDSIKNICIYFFTFLFYTTGYAFFAYYVYGSRSLSKLNFL